MHTRMYRCSSLSISFRWIPNFYMAEKPEQEMRNLCRLSRRQPLSFPSELSLSQDPEVTWKPDEDSLQRNCPVRALVLAKATGPTSGDKRHSKEHEREEPAGEGSMRWALPGGEAREGFQSRQCWKWASGGCRVHGFPVPQGAAPVPSPTFSRVYVARSMISGKCSSYSRMTSFIMSTGGERWREHQG